MSIRKSKWVWVGFFSLSLIACGGGGGGGDDGGGDPGDGSISPTDANAVMESITAAVGGSSAMLVSGTPPAASSGDGAPKVEAGADEVSATPGGEVEVPVVTQASAAISSLFAKVPGADSYFSVSAGGGGGKSLGKSAVVPAKAAASFNIGTLYVLTLQLPDNIEEGEFCLNISVQDAEEQVSEPVTTCVVVVDEIVAPTDDQPAQIETLASALSGEWISECVDIEGDDSYESLKFVFGFDAESGYSTSYQVWSQVDDCSGTADNVLDSVFGSYDIQDDATAENYPTEFDSALSLWQRPFDFVPSDQFSTVDPETGAVLFSLSTCYNVLSVSDSTLYLGVPLVFSIDDEEATACDSPETRPTRVLTGLPLTKVNLNTQ